MISNLFEKNIIKILSLFLISPGSRYSRKELKEKIEMNNAPLDNALSKLLKLKILSKKRNLFELNFESDETKKILEIIKKEFINFNLPHKIFIILIEISNKLSEIKQIRNVLIFGSYAKLIYNENSDVDLAIVTNEKSLDFKKKIRKISEKISQKNEKNIEIHFFSENDLKHKEDPLIKDILRNGKVVF